MNHHPKVLIVGAGLSGLTLAYQLNKLGIDFLIVEGRERLGGRIYTITEAASTVEMGATWYGEKHRALLTLINELGVSYQPQYVGKNVLYDFANPKRTIQMVALPQNQEPSYLFTKGSSSLIQAIHERIPSNRVILGDRITHIGWNGSTFKLFSHNASYEAQFVVNTLPPHLAISTIEFEPNLPDEVIQVSKSTHTWMGESTKVGLTFTQPFWRQKEIGTFFSQFGPIQELHDHSHTEGGLPMLKGFLHPQMRSMRPQQLKSGIEQQMKLYFHSEDAVPEKILSVDWQKEALTYHGYPSFVGPHQNNGHALLRIPRYGGGYFLGGSETASSFPGYMDGAVERAIEVADQLRLAIKSPAVS